MKNFLIAFFLFPQCVFSQKDLTTITFGSCANQNKELTIFQTILSHDPDLFIFLGDNIYGDTYDMKLLESKYQTMLTNPNFRLLKDSVPMIGTWDDHDYGQDDIGRHYRPKKHSKKLFLKFFDEPVFSKRRFHSGIYTSYIYKSHGYRIQIILLDLRTFRDDLLPYDSTLVSVPGYNYSMDYSPYNTGDSTIMGKRQWKWMKNQLKKKADIRIIGSSTQFGTQYNGYETWANFPHEQQRMIELIDKTKAKGVLFISGDLHYAELSKIENPTIYPLYDLTSSGLSENWKFSVPNSNRIGGPIMENNFGKITFDWSSNDPLILLEIWNGSNELKIQQAVHLSELR